MNSSDSREQQALRLYQQLSLAYHHHTDVQSARQQRLKRLLNKAFHRYLRRIMPPVVYKIAQEQSLSTH